MNKLCDLWLDHPEEEFQRAVVNRLQRMVSGLPWLLDFLHPSFFSK